MRIAEPAPACVAAPAGAIGSAADAADAQRNASASGNVPCIDSASKRRNTAVPRSAHEIEISARQARLRLLQWPRELIQRPSRKRRAARVEDRRGNVATIAAASTPAAATTAKPTRTVHLSASAAATDA